MDFNLSRSPLQLAEALPASGSDYPYFLPSLGPAKYCMFQIATSGRSFILSFWLAAETCLGGLPYHLASERQFAGFFLTPLAILTVSSFVFSPNLLTPLIYFVGWALAHAVTSLMKPDSSNPGIVSGVWVLMLFQRVAVLKTLQVHHKCI